ncbi:MAG TPA: SAVED domain-containing protein [Thermoanaerobaculia bacterium]|nr:SAVED domain-containing protein [Thermoanaerobaculia bacterium]
MANQVAARLAGDDYQHLLAWERILRILMPSHRVETVTVEDPDAGAVDDVTSQHEAFAPEADEFLQIKYHVDHRGEYSTAVLFAKKTAASTSLLQKFHRSWRVLVARGRPVELRLISNWTWDAADAVKRCISGQNNALTEEFFSSSAASAVGKAREEWRAHLGLDAAEFEAFARTLRFRLGFDCSDELEARVTERMEFLGLKHDVAALLIGVGIIRTLVKAGSSTVDKAKLRELLDAYDLHAAPEEAATTVYLSTVKQQQFELPPEFLLDWRAYFEGTAHKRGHSVIDPASWNDQMLPELLQLEADLNARGAPRLIRARGLARLSAWFAFGHTFSDVARFIVEVDQQGKLWRTDVHPSELQVIEESRETIPNGDGSTVAVGISVTGPLTDDVRSHLGTSPTAHKLLLLRPDRELGPSCFQSAADVTAFARNAKERVRAFVKEHEAIRVMLFYFGPLSGACFLGHQLNAVAREIQIMEDQQPGYAPAFLLT